MQNSITFACNCSEDQKKQQNKKEIEKKKVLSKKWFQNIENQQQKIIQKMEEIIKS